MATITCIRCSQDKPPLDEAPMGGSLGTTIFERVCADCWGEWRETSGQLINHYTLNLGQPEHREQLRRAMKEFLSLESE